MKTIIATSLVLFSGLLSAGETAHVDAFQGLVDIRQHSIHSETIGKRYEIMVGLPDGYDPSSSERYPTIYLTDGAALFPMLQSYYRYLHFAEDVPAMIFVAISYSDSDWTNESDRGHDYTAPSDEREFYGGGGDFQSMLRDELLPLVESEYRSDPDRRIVFGQSIGGQFVMYTAHTEPGLFWGHIASNPALHRNVEFFLPSQTDLQARAATSLFVVSAENDDERFKQPLQRWVEAWSDIDKKPWQLKVDYLEDHNHFSPAPASFRRGVQWLFSSVN